MSTSGDTTPLEADLAALRKLRDDDASGVTECYGATPTTTQPAPQEQIINEALVNALAKANGGTCNNSCHCVVA